MTGISGFNAGPLPELRQVLQKWIFVNNDYVRRCHGNDAPWWYIERASISTVAAAAWLAKGIALEEYTTSKTRNINRSRSVVSDRGRCDLFISVKDRHRTDRDLIVEAKIRWPSLTSGAFRKRIKDGLIAACKDVRLTHSYGGARRAGLLIVSPTIPKSQNERLEELIREFVDFIRLQSHCAVAWTFPSVARKLCSDKRPRLYPGTAILLRPLRRKI